MIRIARPFLLVLAILAGAGAAGAQSRIKSMPGYEQWATMAPHVRDSVDMGARHPVWAANGRSFDYTLGGQRWRYMLRTGKSAPINTPSPTTDSASTGASGAMVEAPLVFARGRGADANVVSPDGKLRAFTRDANLWITPEKGGVEQQITTDGGAAARVLNGVGSYVYLEEFSVRSPVWWSPDSTKIAWMRYDEQQVSDYYVPLDQTQANDNVLVEAYPHPGANNPVADLMVRDLRTGVTTRMDVRDGQPFSDFVVGHYIWNAEWTANGDELLVFRSDRTQKTIELAGCSPTTGACHSIVREARPQSWAMVSQPVFLNDGKRFIWTSERTNFRNYFLYDVSGRMIAQLTHHDYDVIDIVRIDERNNYMWYTARSGDTYMKTQLHRVKLDGSDDQRLTDPAYDHKVVLSPDGKHFVDIAQTHDQLPVTRLMDSDGKVVAEIASGDASAADDLGFKRAEMFTFTSADGSTELKGLIQFPSNFDPSKKYPVLIGLYGGPSSNSVSETFQRPSALAEFGFLVVRMDARTAMGRGRQILDSVYQQLGVAEIDDFAAGIRSLAARPYVDASRVGVYGTSYGGTVAATLLLRHPDLVQAAASSSPVTDYRLYDSAYSERYLGLPAPDNRAYDQAAVLTYAGQLQGDLLLYFGTSDDNVHADNSLQLIRALQRAGKSFDLQVGPDQGHTGVDQTRMMEFFIDRLVIRPRG